MNCRVCLSFLLWVITNKMNPNYLTHQVLAISMIKSSQKQGNYTPSIGVLIPTFQAANHLIHCLPPIIQSPLKPKVLIIDSSSTDKTAAIAQELGAQVSIIPQQNFNHGMTREKGRLLLGTDIVVMMTQDAYATSNTTLEELVRPLLLGQASISYARQLPHIGAGFFEAFPREFNYPSESHIRSIQDISKYGIYTFFCSNSCAAYLNRALDEVGGFPNVLFGEDTIVVAKLLERQHKIAYVATAEVRHSHAYSLKQEFQRHFDIGLSRHLHQGLLAKGGKDSKRGQAYVKALLSTLKSKYPLYIPYALLQSCIKFLGYKLGKLSTRAPLWLKKQLSSQPHYWTSKS